MFNTSNGVLEENRENNQEAIFKETMVQNFPSMKKTTDSQIQEAQQISSTVNKKKIILYVVVKMENTKANI